MVFLSFRFTHLRDFKWTYIFAPCIRFYWMCFIILCWLWWYDVQQDSKQITKLKISLQHRASSMSYSNIVNRYQNTNTNVISLQSKHQPSLETLHNNSVILAQHSSWICNTDNNHTLHWYNAKQWSLTRVRITLLRSRFIHPVQCILHLFFIITF